MVEGCGLGRLPDLFSLRQGKEEKGSRPSSHHPR